MKKTRGVLSGMAAILVLGSLLTACSDLYNENPGSGGENGGTGYVLVNIGVGARTLLPSAGELYYVLTFVDTNSQKVTATLGGSASKTVPLPTGTWDLAVEAYRSPNDLVFVNGIPMPPPAAPPVAQGSESNIVISGSTTTPVTVELEAFQTGSGTLRYSLTYPNSPTVSDIRLSLEKTDGTFSRTIRLPTSTSQTLTGTVSGLDSGFYQLTISLYNFKAAVAGDLVHIYDGLETPAVFTITAADFTECPDLSSLETKLAEAREERAKTAIGADPTMIDPSYYCVDQLSMDALDAAIATAELILADQGAGLTAGDLSAGLTALDTAITDFTTARIVGTYNPGADPDLGLSINGSPETAAGTTLASALEWLRDNNSSITNNDSLTIVIAGNEDLPPWTVGGSTTGAATALTGKSNITLTLRGKGAERLVRLNAPGSLFTVASGLTLVLDQNITLRGRPDNTSSLVRVNTGATLEMKMGSKISGNSSYSDSSGGGVSVGGTFTMQGGEISGNSSYYPYYSNSDSNGGGVYVYGGIFTMYDGEISGNSSSSGSSSSRSGGGVYNGGTFTMNDGEISGNTSSYSGGGVYVYSGGTFVISGGARVHLNNPVYLPTSAFVTLGSLNPGPDPLALVEPAAAPGFIGQPFIKWQGALTGPLPADRFILPPGWSAQADGTLGVNALPLDNPGETATAYLRKGDAHFYRFTPVLYGTYTLTRSGGTDVYIVAAWADGSGVLMTNDNTYTTTSSGFIANKAEDIIIMVYNGSGNYTVHYNASN
jgi:hypothetical protein